MTEPHVDDGDLRIYVGDVRDVLRELPDESVDCVITSPPYLGLRDYGTGTWEGGDPACTHERPTTTMNHGFNERWGQGAGQRKQETKSAGQWARECPDCGAVRVDRQIGLEPLHDCLGWATGERCGDCYVCSLIEVFAEVRRVLSRHGTVWLNLGDSYASDAAMKGCGLKAKDLIGIPWRVALALQADGWWLRSDVIWEKPNAMPSSVEDRPTVAHEYLFLLAKSDRYWFDADAVREPAAVSTLADRRPPRSFPGGEGGGNAAEFGHAGRPLPTPANGRNIRTVWEIPTRPFAGAHFAVFPPELVRRALLAGCPLEVCVECGRPRERIVEKGEPELQADTWSANGAAQYDDETGSYELTDSSSTLKHVVPRTTVGWTDCGCNGGWRPGVVLDPFMGSGTTGIVARQHGRHAVGIELNERYADMAAGRLAQQALPIA